jgi:uncharacterized protein YdiU (UPF0061 family)
MSSMTAPRPLALEHSYASLPERFYARVAPTPVAAPRLLALRRALAEELGADPAYLESPAGVAILAGNRVPDGAQPIAMVYAGHQFGHFVPRLGDGRAVLLGELRDRGGALRDLHLKGAGRTSFSRMGDGRAALGPVLREYVVSEAMAALGIPTTRALAMVATGEPVYREEGPLPGATLARVAASHVRVGTFEYFAARGDRDGVRALADYVIARLYPEAGGASSPYRALLEIAMRRQAELIALWMSVGFIHGVMNTDNAAIAGETLDFGPCAFLDTYHPATVYSSIDRGGRYAYGQQPGIGLWNMTRFAETLLPLLDADEEAAVALARETLGAYPDLYRAAYEDRMRRKLGLGSRRDDDAALVNDLLECMAAGSADFTLVFRGLASAADGDAESHARGRELFSDPRAFDAWAVRWRARLASEPGTAAERRAVMQSVNPAYIPRNHRVEQAIQAAIIEGDLRPFERLFEAVTRPYEDQPNLRELAEPPKPDEVVHETFCGT